MLVKNQPAFWPYFGLLMSKLLEREQILSTPIMSTLFNCFLCKNTILFDSWNIFPKIYVVFLRLLIYLHLHPWREKWERHQFDDNINLILAPIVQSECGGGWRRAGYVKLWEKSIRKAIPTAQPNHKITTLGQFCNCNALRHRSCAVSTNFHYHFPNLI